MRFIEVSSRGPAAIRSRTSLLVTIVACLVAGCAAKREASSYEELFMGQRRPFGEQGAGPMPGKLPEETVEALYGDEVFFHLRNAVPPVALDHVSGCFTASLTAHFVEQRRQLDLWFRKNEGSNLKAPVGEGSVFLSTYEGAASFRLGKATLRNGRAHVPVHLVWRERGETYPWTDVAVLVRDRDRWLLDDILFRPAEGGGMTLRKSTTVGG